MKILVSAETTGDDDGLGWSDLSLRSVTICIRDQGGKVRLDPPVSSEIPDLVGGPRAFGEPVIRLDGRPAR